MIGSGKTGSNTRQVEKRLRDPMRCRPLSLKWWLCSIVAKRPSAEQRRLRTILGPSFERDDGGWRFANQLSNRPLSAGLPSRRSTDDCLAIYHISHQGSLLEAKQQAWIFKQVDRSRWMMKATVQSAYQVIHIPDTIPVFSFFQSFSFLLNRLQEIDRHRWRMSRCGVWSPPCLTGQTNHHYTDMQLSSRQQCLAHQTGC